MSEERSSEVSNQPPEAAATLHGDAAGWPTQEFADWTSQQHPEGATGADPAGSSRGDRTDADGAPANPAHLGPGAAATPGWARALPPSYPGTQTMAGPRPPSGASARPGPRRARLTLKRVDPWSVLKVTFVYSLAAMLIFLVAVSLLYAILSMMGVFHSLDTFLSTVGASGKASTYVSFSRILLYSGIIGGVNVVLFSALATIGAFVYNICAELVGGLELTLTETQ